MTVRDVYIFEGLGRPDAGDDRDDRDDPEDEALDDVRYARRLRRSPLITDRSVRRAARERRAAAITELEIEDDVSDTPDEEAVLTRAAFGGRRNLGAALVVIGLLIILAAWTGPTWGWEAGSGFEGVDAYGFREGPHFAYADDVGYHNEPYARYAAFDTDLRQFVDPSRAMLAGGTLLLVGVVLLATRRRSFLGLG